MILISKLNYLNSVARNIFESNFNFEYVSVWSLNLTLLQIFVTIEKYNISLYVPAYCTKSNFNEKRNGDISCLIFSFIYTYIVYLRIMIYKLNKIFLFCIYNLYFMRGIVFTSFAPKATSLLCIWCMKCEFC